MSYTVPVASCLILEQSSTLLETCHLEHQSGGEQDQGCLAEPAASWRCLPSQLTHTHTLARTHTHTHTHKHAHTHTQTYCSAKCFSTGMMNNWRCQQRLFDQPTSQPALLSHFLTDRNAASCDCWCLFFLYLRIFGILTTPWSRRWKKIC